MQQSYLLPKLLSTVTSVLSSPHPSEEFVRLIQHSVPLLEIGKVLLQ